MLSCHVADLDLLKYARCCVGACLCQNVFNHTLHVCAHSQGLHNAGLDLLQYTGFCVGAPHTFWNADNTTALEKEVKFIPAGKFCGQAQCPDADMNSSD